MTIGTLPFWTNPDAPRSGAIAPERAPETPPPPPLLCSVIIPVYNGAGFLARALDALAAQQLAPESFEIILVDDGSTDDTWQVVRNWQSAHSAWHVRMVAQQNRGQGAARNHGARLAQSPILLFTDADCVPVRGWAVAFLEALRGPSAPDAAMGTYTTKQDWRAPRFAQLEFEERYARMARHGAIDLIATYSAAYKRDVFLAAGGFDENLVENEDVEFSYRLSEAGRRMVFVPEAQVQHEHDLTWLDYANTKMGRGYWRTMVYRRHPGKAGKDSYTPQLLKLQVLLAPLALLGFVAAICTRNPRRLGSALPFLLTTVPLVRFGVQRHSPATFWAPFGSLVRALAFGAGIAQAFIALFTGKALRGRRAQIAAAAAGTAGDQAQPRKESREAL